jgi:type 1 glutamine amidotransferase
MTLRTILTGTAAACAVGALCAALVLPHRAAHAQAARAKKHLLVVTVTKGFRHGSIPVAEKTIESLGDTTGAWDTDFVRTDEEMAEKMTPAALRKYDGIVFANTTGVLPLPDPQGFLDYIRAGHGFVAMHSGSDTFHEWPNGPSGEVSAYVKMLGAEFQTHHSQCAVDAHLLDPKHPALKQLAKAGANVASSAVSDDELRKASVVQGRTWKAFDEIYLFKNVDRANLRALLTMDKHPNDGSPEANQPGEYLISWCKSYGKGRVFYTSFGHRQEMWRDPLYQAHITGGIEFALGLAKGSTQPNPL